MRQERQEQEQGETHRRIEVGVYTLGDLCPDPATGRRPTARERIRDIIEAAKLADEAGLDVFGVGEHHRLDHAVSATPVVLSAIAQATRNIKLTSATTILSTVDPVRLFEEYATLDLISGGRAEIIAGRGAFMESFPLFGYNTDDYAALFEENMELLLKLNEEEIISWTGRFRPPLHRAEVAPRPAQGRLPVWIGVGGTTETAAFAGRLGVGLAIAILGGDPARFAPHVEAYREASRAAGHDPRRLRLAITGHGYVAKTTRRAKDEFFPYYANYLSFVNRRKGIAGPGVTRAEFDRWTAPETALFVGSPQRVAEKVLRQRELFGHTRFMMQMDIGGVPFRQVAESIELLATEVAPLLRRG